LLFALCNDRKHVANTTTTIISSRPNTINAALTFFSTFNNQ
jgi:hypothetical protein